MNCIYTVAANSSSVMYGNISQHVKTLIKSYFTKDFFKYEAISSEIAYRNIRRQLQQNLALGRQNTLEMSKRQKPYLIINPVFGGDNDDDYLNGTAMTTNMDHVESFIDARSIKPIIQDTVRGIGLGYKPNWDKITFEVTITVGSQISQIDVKKAIQNIIYWNRPFTKRLPVESMIPRSMVKALANLNHLTMADPDVPGDSYKAGPIVDYLNMYSNSPITYKMRNASGNDEFFVYNNREILFTFSDLNMDSSMRKMMSNDTFNITFNVTAEFVNHGLFILFGDESLKSKVSELVDLSIGINQNEFFPIFTLDNIYGTNEEETTGFRRLTSSILQLEPDKVTQEDTSSLLPLFSNETMLVIRNHISNNNDIATLMHVKYFKNNELLTEGTDFTLDYYTMKLITKNATSTDSYRIIVYLNSVLINSMLSVYTDKNAQDLPKLSNS